ncbi:MAG TPA: SurA N-terminal domain-containing protein [Acetobacteraceae bacterium]|nr:SurA N-terminal domain-containing protein [Acetobacteraceae bacterium]
MITAFRRYLGTWVVRGFFLIMVAAFVLWGVGDVVRMVGTSPTWVAKVGDQTVESQQLQEAYQRQMAQITAKLPSGQEPSQEVRNSVAKTTLQQLIGQAALDQELQRLHIVAPDAAVRQSVFATPAFNGPSGQFDRQTFETVLRNNGLTEPRFLDMVRGQLQERQLLEAVTAGAAASESMLHPLYESQFEKRSANTVEFPLAAASEPSGSTEAELQRWYDNHPDQYSAPEYRRIKAVVLSPETLAKDIPITEADLHAAYQQHLSDYVKSEKRSAEVISVSEEAKANALATTWKSGADWGSMQKAAKEAGGTAIALDDATQSQFPDAGLAKTVFGAAQDTVTGPTKGALGWYLVRVVNISAGSTRSFAEVQDLLRNQVLAAKAADMMYDRANKVDNALGTGADLDHMPDNLGLVGVAGTLDAEGETQAGTPAPIPGPPELKAALIKAAFTTPKSEPPQLVEVQTPSTGGSAYYAVSVEDIIPPAVKPFDTVKQQVTDGWTQDQRRRTEEAAATKLLTAVKGGQSLADAATVAGVTVRRTPLVTREARTEGMPAQLVQVLFGLKKGEPTMVETPDGFIVATPAEIVEADPKTDPAGFDQLRTAVIRSIAGDLASVFADALRARAQPRINQAALDNITGQPQ